MEEGGYDETLLAIPHFASYGPRFRSTAPQELTESETEYVVNCVKHIFADHIVFQVPTTLNIYTNSKFDRARLFGLRTLSFSQMPKLKYYF